MADLFDYLKWRGDLSFAISKFNTIDALILCQLSYINFNEIIPTNLKEISSFRYTDSTIICLKTCIFLHKTQDYCAKSLIFAQTASAHERDPDHNFREDRILDNHHIARIERQIKEISYQRKDKRTDSQGSEEVQLSAQHDCAKLAHKQDKHHRSPHAFGRQPLFRRDVKRHNR